MTPDSTVFSQYLSSLPPVSEPDFLENAKTFLTFASGFDLADPKIELKLRHTFHVVDACFYLARALKLSDEETYIACLIGLLHDVGRFEQLTRFHSFDDSLIPHAKLSVKFLFLDGHIQDYLAPKYEAWSPVIEAAIEYHGVFQVPDGLPENVLLFTQLIRDADKLDNFRVKATDSMEAMLDVTEADLSRESLSDYAYETFMKKEPLINSLRETRPDMWLSYVAYLFDLNFPASFVWIRESGYMEKILRRYAPIDPEDKKLWQKISGLTRSYIQENCGLSENLSARS